MIIMSQSNKSLKSKSMLYFIVISIIALIIQGLLIRAEIKMYKQVIANYKKETNEICQ